jgi:hypothetical protein
MEIATSLQCPCRPGFNYKNDACLAVHKKTKLHKAWETKQEVKDVRTMTKKLENKLAQKEAVEKVLLERIQILEETNAYLKAQLKGVYIN